MARDIRLRIFARYWLPVFAYVAVVFVLSSIPKLTSPVRFVNSDKLIHVVEYGVMGLLLVRALRTVPRLEGALVSGLLAVTIGAAVGGADELFQRFVPGRESSVLDVVADALGLALATIGYLWAQRRRLDQAPSWMAPKSRGRRGPGGPGDLAA